MLPPSSIFEIYVISHIFFQVFMNTCQGKTELKACDLLSTHRIAFTVRLATSKTTLKISTGSALRAAAVLLTMECKQIFCLCCGVLERWIKLRNDIKKKAQNIWCCKSQTLAKHFNAKIYNLTLEFPYICWLCLLLNRIYFRWCIYLNEYSKNVKKCVTHYINNVKVMQKYSAHQKRQCVISDYWPLSEREAPEGRNFFTVPEGCKIFGSPRPEDPWCPSWVVCNIITVQQSKIWHV